MVKPLYTDTQQVPQRSLADIVLSKIRERQQQAVLVPVGNDRYLLCECVYLLCECVYISIMSVCVRSTTMCVYSYDVCIRCVYTFFIIITNAMQSMCTAH